MIKRAILILSVALFAMGVGVYTKIKVSTFEFNKDNLSPDFFLSDIHGSQHSINEWRGKIRVINFWATWCSPCRKEIPEFITIQNQYALQGVQFIGIAIDNKEAINRYLSEIPINYPILIAENEGLILARQMGNSINSVPFTIIINQQGVILERYFGEINAEKLEEEIRSLI